MFRPINELDKEEMKELKIMNNYVEYREQCNINLGKVLKNIDKGKRTMEYYEFLEKNKNLTKNVTFRLSEVEMEIINRLGEVTSSTFSGRLKHVVRAFDMLLEIPLLKNFIDGDGINNIIKD